MLSGIRIYTSDIVWRQILGDLGACVLNAPTLTDINFDDLEISDILTPMELKTILVKHQVMVLNGLDLLHNGQLLPLQMQKVLQNILN